jgi:hypothetical protein
MSLLGFAMITASKFAASAVRSNAPIFPVFLELPQLESKVSLSLNPIIALILSWLQPKFLQ